MIEIIKYPDQSSYVKEEKFLPNITLTDNEINSEEDVEIKLIIKSEKNVKLITYTILYPKI
mgnify:CR=1 FL=1|jgi:hypothetical protein